MILKDLNIKNNRVSVRISTPGKAHKYLLHNKIYVEYENIDLNEIPNSILIIPFVATLVHICWACGEDLYLDEIDSDYLSSLKKLKEYTKESHPNFSFKSEIIARVSVKNNVKTNGSILLYSGGIDSLTSYIRNKNSITGLYTMWGCDVPLFEKKSWKRIKSDIEMFASTEMKTPFYSKTNLLTVYNDKKLSKDYYLSNWWAEINHGIILISSIFPICYLQGDKVIIGSSHTEKYRPKFWGSCPAIDEVITASSIKVLHDGYEFVRQDKIEQYIVKETKLNRFLRVCYSDVKKFNCGLCEKCLRTIVGLLAAGEDPRNYNFDFNQKKSKHLVKKFEMNKMYFSKQNLFFWKRIQNTIISKKSEDLGCYNEFSNLYIWFETFNFDEYCLNWKKNVYIKIQEKLFNFSLKKILNKLYMTLKAIKYKKTGVHVS